MSTFNEIRWFKTGSLVLITSVCQIHKIRFSFSGLSYDDALRWGVHFLHRDSFICSGRSSGKAIKASCFFFPEAGAHPQPREQNSKGAGEVGSAGETKVGSQ